MQLKRNFGIICFAAAIVGLLASLISIHLLLARAVRKEAELESLLSLASTPNLPRRDNAPDEEVLRLLKEPPTFDFGQKRLFMSETRVLCVRCKKPISLPADASLCPFCGNWKGPGKKQDYPVRLAFYRDFIATADSITFVFKTWHQGKDPRDSAGQRPAPLQMVVTNQPAVSDFVRRVEFVAKDPCLCAHDQKIVFGRGSQKLTVSICSHCFDLYDVLSPPAQTHPLALHFQMPESVWNAFAFYEQTGRSKSPSSEEVEDAASENATPDASSNVR